MPGVRTGSHGRLLTRTDELSRALAASFHGRLRTTLPNSWLQAGGWPTSWRIVKDELRPPVLVAVEEISGMSAQAMNFTLVASIVACGSNRVGVASLQGYGRVRDWFKPDERMVASVVAFGSNRAGVATGILVKDYRH